MTSQSISSLLQPQQQRRMRDPQEPPETTTSTTTTRASLLLSFVLVLLSSTPALAVRTPKTPTTTTWNHQQPAQQRRPQQRRHAFLTLRSSLELASGDVDALANPLRLLRGGSSMVDDEEEDEDDDEEEEEEDEDDEEEEEEEDEDDDEEEDDEGQGQESSALVENGKKPPSLPVPIHIKTSFGYELLDQTLDLNVPRHRTVANVKDLLRRQLPGKPPMELLHLRQDGRLVQDEELVEDLLDDDEEEEEEDEEGDETKKSGGLHLVLDMVPPMDSKSMVKSLQEKLSDLTTSDLLQIYATNEAALHETSTSLFQSSQQTVLQDEDEEDDDKDSSLLRSEAVTPKVKERARLLRAELESLLLERQPVERAKEARKLLEESRPPSATQSLVEIRGERTRYPSTGGGVPTSWKRQLQVQFNVDWTKTMYQMILCWAFGYFGGRTSFSQNFFYLAGPMLLLLQARPVKLLGKKLIYTLLDHPPSIVLSLLPAPQQSIFKLDFEQEMIALYGNYTTETQTLKPERALEQAPLKPLITAPVPVDDEPAMEEYEEVDDEEIYALLEEGEDDYDDEDEDED